MADGREIAYRVLSEHDGPVIVHTHASTSPIEILDEDPMYDRFLRTLGRYGRVVVFDKPGSGASDPFDRERDYFDQTVDAFLAVLDAVDAAAGWLVGVQAWEAARLAVEHPGRLSGAVLLDPTAPNTAPPFDVRKALTERDYDSAAVLAPSRVDDPVFIAWLRRAKRMGASGADARDYGRAVRAASVRRVAEAEPVTDAPPVLLLHRRDFQDVAHHEYWNHFFPDAKCVTIDGAGVLVLQVDAGHVAEIAASFITGTPVKAAVERHLMAVLFTDLVDSTRRAAQSGDAAWKMVLDHHDEVTRDEVCRNGGDIGGRLDAEHGDSGAEKVLQQVAVVAGYFNDLAGCVQIKPRSHRVHVLFAMLKPAVRV